LFSCAASTIIIDYWCDAGRLQVWILRATRSDSWAVNHRQKCAAPKDLPRFNERGREVVVKPGASACDYAATRAPTTKSGQGQYFSTARRVGHQRNTNALDSAVSDIVVEPGNGLFPSNSGMYFDKFGIRIEGYRSHPPNGSQPPPARPRVDCGSLAPVERFGNTPLKNLAVE